MCGSCDDHFSASSGEVAHPVPYGDDTYLDVDEVADFIAAQPEVRRTAVGFIGYGQTGPGDRVLIAINSFYSHEVAEAVARALRRRGASVDLLEIDPGDDRPLREDDEIEAMIRRRPSVETPRRWEKEVWIERFAADKKYDLLIQGRGGGIPPTEYRYEAIPWLSRDHFVSQATVYPRELSVLINSKVWENFFTHGREGRVYLSDPEGTQLQYTIFNDYFDGSRRGYNETPFWGHIMAHGPTPILGKEDAQGVICGTTSHYSLPFPRIELDIESGRLSGIRGGGDYGRAWQALEKETADTKYPSFPDAGLFWLWEVAIGTNPKIARPKGVRNLSSGALEWERRKSGVIHMGLGTRWRGEEEKWAGNRGLAYGHLHVHLMRPSLVIETRMGEQLDVIVDGRLKALDDPAVQQLAEQYPGGQALLEEEWVPSIPGITAPGSYDDYAARPADFM